MSLRHVPLPRSLRIACVRQTDANPTAFHGYDSPLRQVRLALGDDTSAYSGLLQITKIDEPDDSRVGRTEGNRKLAEILVERDQYLPVSCRVGKDFVVSWIGRPVTYPLHLVPGPFEIYLGAGPDATVEQELQAASPVTAGSTRSWPTTRRA